jgi:hypothetical protein
MSEQGSPQAGDYVFVPARSISNDKLIEFAAATWPRHANSEKILSSWWQRAEPHCAVAAIHKATGTMSGVCAGLPSSWIIGGKLHSAVAISTWYVSPQHAGKGLGKRLVQNYAAPGAFMYAFSISKAAAANFTKLGWLGPDASFLLVLPLPRLVTIPLLFLGSNGLDLRDRTVDTGLLPSALGADLDRIEAARVDAPAHMRRTALEWARHLSIAGARSYRFCVAYRGGEPLGFAVVRPLAPGSSQLGKLKAAMITDLVALSDEPAVLRALAVKAIMTASEMGATILLTVTTAAAHRRALSALGFLSSATYALGPFLKRRAPQFMWAPHCGLTADDIRLTFADSDLDFNL